MASHIYTRTGDAGETGLFGGRRVSKDHVRVEAYGTVDELNTLLGVAQAQCRDEELRALLLSFQHTLFQLGADLATPSEEKTRRGNVTIQRIETERVERLEALIDRYEAELSPLRNFILPGGTPLAAALHHCRAVCRRAERRCVTLQIHESTPEQPALNSEALRYLNRLSDLLFVLARVANRRRGADDTPWNPE
jgi:cob(I)alamin adenosyltransferase